MKQLEKSTSTAPKIDSDYSIKALALAVYLNAVRDARRGDTLAWQWLYSDGFLWLDAVTNIHPDHVRRWLDRTLKLNSELTPNLDPQIFAG